MKPLKKTHFTILNWLFTGFTLLFLNIVEAQIQRVRINFQGPDLGIRQLLIGFTPDDSATDNFDYGWDSKSSTYPPNDLNWLIDNERYIIQGVGSFNTTKSYPLGLFLNMAGEIKIHLVALENFTSAIDVFIHNSEDNTYVQINDSDFESLELSGDKLNKYRLAFEVPPGGILLSDEKFDLDEIVVKGLRSSNEVLINGQGRYTIDKLSIYNIGGQKVFQTNNIGSTKRKIHLPYLSNQVLIATIETDKGTLSKKVIL